MTDRPPIWVALCNGSKTRGVQEIFAGSYEEVMEMVSGWWVEQGGTYEPQRPPPMVWGTNGVKATSCNGHWVEILNFQGPDAPSIRIEKAKLIPIKREQEGAP